MGKGYLSLESQKSRTSWFLRSWRAKESASAGQATKPYILGYRGEVLVGTQQLSRLDMSTIGRDRQRSAKCEKTQLNRAANSDGWNRERRRSQILRSEHQSYGDQVPRGNRRTFQAKKESRSGPASSPAPPPANERGVGQKTRSQTIQDLSEKRSTH